MIPPALPPNAAVPPEVRNAYEQARANLETERRLRLTRQINDLAGKNLIPADQAPQWLERAMDDESILNLLVSDYQSCNNQQPERIEH